MKLIVAVIRPETLGTVEAALYHQNVCVLSVSQVHSGGREPGYTEIYRGREVHSRRPKIRLEMMAEDVFVEYAVEAIARASSDGKVFVLPLSESAGIGNVEHEAVALER